MSAVPPRAAPEGPPHLAGARIHQRARRALTALIIGAVLSGCSTSSPETPSADAARTSASAETPTLPATSPPPTTASIPASTVTPMTGTELTSVGTSASAVGTEGTVLPFRTAGPDDAAGRRIGLVAAAGSDEFSRAVTDSVAVQATLAGAELIRCDPGNDLALVLDCARRLSTQDVDGWIVDRATGVEESLCELGPVGAPLVTVAGDPVSCATVAVGADDVRAGYLVGAALGRAARQRDTCAQARLVVVGAAGVSTDAANSPEADTGTAAERIDGIRAGFAGQCPGRGDAEVLVDPASRTVLGAALAQLPADADVLIAAVDDVSAQQVTAAMPLIAEEEGVPTTVATVATVATVGAGEAVRCQILTDQRWIGAAALFPDRYGQVVVPALLDALAGQAVPALVNVQTTFLTATTIKDYYDTTGCAGS